MEDLRSFNLEELSSIVEEFGEKKFRAKQLYEWIHKKRVATFEEMTNISKGLKEKLMANYFFAPLKPLQVLTSKIDGTQKYLFRLYDGNVIEAVLMKYKYGNSVCISTQVGCRMGCRFCASTIDGRTRNLTPGEMLAEVYTIEHITKERVSHIVLMGAGEPMDNFDYVVRFLDMITNDQGMNLSGRNITVSTCGLVPKIKELADLKLQVTLAISLHASNDETRKELMPIANKYSIAQVLEACDYYFQTTGRRISFEYSLVKDVNDTREGAKELASLLKGRNCHVNLIPVNPIEERDFKQPTWDNIYRFKEVLEKHHINVTIRREMGRDINGSCGQLRKNYLEEGGQETFDK